jgi:diacylglycerol kinase (ATP)
MSLPLSQSFRFAFQGIKSFFRHCRNARIHLAIAILVVVIGMLLHITRLEWMVIVLCISMVFAAEMFNEAMERLCDQVHPSQHPMIGRVKDMSAGAVLVVAIASAIIGGLIFLPYLTALLH